MSEAVQPIIMPQSRNGRIQISWNERQSQLSEQAERFEYLIVCTVLEKQRTTMTSRLAQCHHTQHSASVLQSAAVVRLLQQRTAQASPSSSSSSPSSSCQHQQHQSWGREQWISMLGEPKTKNRLLPLPLLDNIWVMVIVWRLRGNIIRTANCWIVWHNVHSQQHTCVSNSYRSNRLGSSLMLCIEAVA